MGAEQSSARDSAGAQGPPPSVAKTCYYEVLGIDRLASDEECVFLSSCLRVLLLIFHLKN
jgi:hypothetical protein